MDDGFLFFAWSLGSGSLCARVGEFQLPVRMFISSILVVSAALKQPTLVTHEPCLAEVAITVPEEGSELRALDALKFSKAAKDCNILQAGKVLERFASLATLGI